MSDVFQPSDLLTIGLLVGLEGVLSADNAMVLALLVLGLPKSEQKKALRYGIVGAFLFRGAATLAAAYLIKLGWVKLAGAAYLLYLSFDHFFRSNAETRRAPPRARPWLGLSPFWATVVKVELTDVVRHRLDSDRRCHVVEALGHPHGACSASSPCGS